MNRWELSVLSRTLSDAERLEALVMPVPWTGCWIWMGGVAKRGHPYGHFWCRKTKQRGSAHRASWEIYRGEIPVGIHVLHKCDVPQCVNPDHLFLGTHSENILDCSRKGRMPQKKLSDDDVANIRSSKLLQREIAA